MSQLLDLAITLTPPGKGKKQSKAIANFTMNFDAQGMHHSGTLLHELLTEQERNDLRWYLEEYGLWPFYEFAERGKRIEALLVEVGKRLYREVFGNSTAAGIVQAWRLYPEKDVTRQISIISDLPRVLSMPWELLHDEQGFLCLRTRNPITIVRRLPKGELAEFSTPFEPPLRILLVTARPTGTGFLDPRGAKRQVFWTRAAWPVNCLTKWRSR